MYLVFQLAFDHGLGMGGQMELRSFTFAFSTVRLIVRK